MASLQLAIFGVLALLIPIWLVALVWERRTDPDGLATDAMDATELLGSKIRMAVVGAIGVGFVLAQQVGMLAGDLGGFAAQVPLHLANIGVLALGWLGMERSLVSPELFLLIGVGIFGLSVVVRNA